MNDKSGQSIQKQMKLIADFEKRHVADQGLINAQNDLIVVLEEKNALLEKEKQSLIGAGNELSTVNEKLEKICAKQQELLESFSRIFSDQ